MRTVNGTLGTFLGVPHSKDQSILGVKHPGIGGFKRDCVVHVGSGLQACRI